MKKLILGFFLTLAMMAFTTNTVSASEGASEPTEKCGTGKCGGDEKNETTAKCGAGKCGGGK